MEVHTNAKRYKYNIFDAWITRQEILMTNVMLTSKMKLKPEVEKEAERRMEEYRRR
jgi:hypothetical protein